MTSITRVAERALEPVARRLQSELHTPTRRSRMAVVIGRLLGTGLVICFATGAFSHFLQHPVPGMFLPASPSWIYRLTQGVHVATGIALIPLLLGKLWTIYPLLFQWPAIRGPVHLLERASIALFVSSALVELGIGLLDTYHWYPFPFYFLQVHYVLAWILIGSLAIHIAVKLPIIRRHWFRLDEERADD